jgi:hypothetical protein
MHESTIDSSRYASLRRGGKILGRLAWWVQLGFVVLGIGLFLDQARGLVSDAQFTWGERRVMGIVALITLGGCGLAGWVIGQLFRVSAGVLDVLADSAEASWRTGDLIEQHLVPTLGRIALVLEEQEGAASSRSASVTNDPGVKTLQSELASARLAVRAVRVMELRDALTQHLRGEALHSLDCELALWLLGVVERRVRSGSVDAEVAGWVARALDSFGEMPEADPLRVALPALRRSAGLCQRCGRPVRGPEPVCRDCRTKGAGFRASSDPTSRSSSNRERP